MNLYTSDTYIKDLNTAIKESVGIEKIKGKTILITGATGTIGSFLVDMLLEYNKLNANINVIAAGRSLKRLQDRFDMIKSNKLQYLVYDILEPIQFNFSVDYIIHAAGNAHPLAFNNDPVGTIIGNINGTYNILEYARLHNTKRVCYISSGEVYGLGDINLNSFSEDYSGYLDPISARSCYPSSKRTAETLCASYTKQYGLETVIVRPCHTYGPGMTSSDSRAHVQFIRNVLNDENIILKSSGSQIRSYCYIADCASAIMTCLSLGESGQAYNSANPNAIITIAGLAEIIAKCAGKKVIFKTPDAVDIANQTPIIKQVLDSKKLEHLGWKGFYSIEKGIRNTLSILNGN